MIPEDDLHAEIARLADELGRVPLYDDMSEHGRFSPTPYIRRYDTWEQAIEEAGFEYPRIQRYSIDQLLEEVRRMAEDGHAPTRTEMEAEGNIHPSIYYSRPEFDTWDDVATAAGLKPAISRNYSPAAQALASMEPDEFEEVL